MTLASDATGPVETKVVIDHLKGPGGAQVYSLRLSQPDHDSAYGR